MTAAGLNDTRGQICLISAPADQVKELKVFNWDKSSHSSDLKLAFSLDLRRQKWDKSPVFVTYFRMTYDLEIGLQSF